MVEGRCLCGDVRVRAEWLPETFSACHCDNCRRWGGGAQMGLDVPVVAVTVTGPVKVHRSSALAERAWCEACGSSLWLRDVDGEEAGVLWLSPGLFDDLNGACLNRVVYADLARGFTFGGELHRVSAEDYARRYPTLDGGCA